MECWALHLRLKTEKSKKLEQVLNQICGRLCVLGLFHFIWWKLQFLEKRSLWIVGAIYCFILDITWVDDLTEESGDFSVENLWRFITEWRSCFSGCADHPLTVPRVEIFGQMRLQPFDLIWFVSDWTTVELNVDCSQFTKFGIREICALPICLIAVFTGCDWEEKIVQRNPQQKFVQFYSNQEYCTLTGFQLFCLIPNNWDW